MTPFRSRFVTLLVATLWCSACAGIPVSGVVGGQSITTRVDSEAARYYVANYLAGKRAKAPLDARIDAIYRNGDGGLPDRNRLKQLSDDFSTDFAALYFADRIGRAAKNRRLRNEFAGTLAGLDGNLSNGRTQLPAEAARYEFLLVPGYLYERHSFTGADLAAPRATLDRLGLAHHFVATIEDGAIERNAEIVAGAIRRRSSAGRRLIVVSVSKSGPEVAWALTQLGEANSRRVAAWVNIVGTLQGSALADDGLLQVEELSGQVDIAGVESLSTRQSRERFRRFHIPAHVLVVNYIGIPLAADISMLARSGFSELKPYGPNDGLSLLADLVMPDGLTLAEIGRDHFLLDDRVDAATAALAITLIGRLEAGRTGQSAQPDHAGKSSDLSLSGNKGTIGLQPQKSSP